MKKYLIGIMGLLLLSRTAQAATSFVPWYGDYTNQVVTPIYPGANVKGSYFTATSTTSTSTFPNASISYLVVPGYASITVIPLQDTYSNLSGVVASSGQMVYFTDRKDQAVGDGVTTIGNLPFVPTTANSYTWALPQTYNEIGYHGGDLTFLGTSSSLVAQYNINVATSTNSAGPGVNLVLTSGPATTTYSNYVVQGTGSGVVSIQGAPGYSVPSATSSGVFVYGGNGGAITILGGAGGNSLFDTNGGADFGGNGGGGNFVSGIGGNASSSNNGGTIQTAGNSGNWAFTTSAGGRMMAGGGNGGNSGNFTVQTGTGGNGSGNDIYGLGNQGGNSGFISLVTGNTATTNGSSVFDQSGQVGGFFVSIGGVGSIATNLTASTPGSPISMKAGNANSVTGLPAAGGNFYAVAGKGGIAGSLPGSFIIGYYVPTPALPFTNIQRQYTALSVGSTSPFSAFTVIGASSTDQYFYPYNLYIASSTAGQASQLVVQRNGNVGINNGNPAHLLSINDTLTDSLYITSSNTGSTAFDLSNTSAGGKIVQFFVTGSGNSPGNFGVYNSTDNKGMWNMNMSNGTMSIISTAAFGWGANTFAPYTLDTGISRDSAGVIDAGNGTQGDKTGQINLATLNYTNAVSQGGNTVLDSAGNLRDDITQGGIYDGIGMSLGSNTNILTSTGATTKWIPTVPVSTGGTSASTFTQGWIFSNGGTGALAASTSPTVNYLVATSTIATSYFNGSLAVLNKFGIATNTPTYPFTMASSTSSNTNISSIDQWGHRITGGTAPTCGAGCSSVVGDDVNMRAITGVGVTSVVINFAHTYTTTPVCFSSDESGGTTVSDASSTPTTVTMNLSASLTTKSLAVHCETSVNFTH